MQGSLAMSIISEEKDESSVPQPNYHRLPLHNNIITSSKANTSSVDAFTRFITKNPQYADTKLADHIRKQDYFHLRNHTCFDYSGFGLYSKTQLSSWNLQPHSFALSCNRIKLNSQIFYEERETVAPSVFEKKIMSFLKISESEYIMVSSANRTSSFKMLAESYPFHTHKNLLTLYDHESEAVSLMMQAGKKKGAKVTTAEFCWPGLKINHKKLERLVSKRKKTNRGLFIFPPQSQITGTRYAYQWLSVARTNGWHVVLDASASAAKDMESLGLSLIKPEFIVCSFYNVFGDDPSGFAAIFIKRSIVSILDTSKFVIVQSQKPENNLEIVCRCLDHADSMGLFLISIRLRCLADWLVHELMKLRYSKNDYQRYLVRVYGPQTKLDRGSSIAMNLFDWKGEKIEPELVQKIADRSNISVNCGVLKNIWFSHKYKDDKSLLFDKGLHENDIGISVVNVSLNFLNDFEDVYKLRSFVAMFLDTDFIEKERWSHAALNQTIVEV